MSGQRESGRRAGKASRLLVVRLVTRGALALALAVGLLGAAAAPAAAEGSPNCSATLRVVSNWGTGFAAEIVLHNVGDAAWGGWNVQVTLSGSATVRQFWGAIAPTPANPVTATNTAWNGAVQPNARLAIGFTAAGPLGTIKFVCNTG